MLGTRWYRQRADEGYRAEMATFGEVNTSIGESAEAGRTVEALGLQARRIARVRRRHPRLDQAPSATRCGCGRCGSRAPRSATCCRSSGVVIAGGFLFSNGTVDLGEVTAVALYVQMLIEPVDLVISWLDELQIGKASMARLLGVRYVPAGPPTPTRCRPRPSWSPTTCGSPTATGTTCCTGSTSTSTPGRGSRSSARAAPARARSGRLLAGVHPPRTGRVTVGGVDVSALEPAALREQVALVTQEHHVFVGTLHDNVVLARPGADIDARPRLRSTRSTRWSGPTRCRPGWTRSSGRAATRSRPRRRSRSRWPGIVLADPHTLVLDEATSLLDPRAARHLERSLAAVLHGRTVIAIAHRLHTAHDADKVAVVEDGRVAEFGSHDELMASGGAYAALWASWREGSTAVAP